LLILVGLSFATSAFAFAGKVYGSGSTIEGDRTQAISEATTAANAQMQAACAGGAVTNVYTLNSDATLQGDGYHAFVAVTGTCNK
jgi:hypothetical protein